MSVGALLVDVGEIPALPGASCRDHVELFDATIKDGWGHPPAAVREAREAARQVCASCPCLADCAAWVRGLPVPLRPRGVVGGALTDPQGRRPTDTPEAPEP
jgi:hypothetical protein